MMGQVGTAAQALRCTRDLLHAAKATVDYGLELFATLARMRWPVRKIMASPSPPNTCPMLQAK